MNLGYFNQHISGRRGLSFYCWSHPAVSPSTNGFHSPFSHSRPKRNRISQQNQTSIVIEGTFKEGLGHRWGDAEFPHHAGCRLDPRGSHLASVDIKLWNRNAIQAAADPPKHAETSKATSVRSGNCCFSQNMPNCSIACDLSQLPLLHYLSCHQS